MRHHWHGTTAHRPPGQRGSDQNLTEKSENKRLTLKRESVICTPRAAEKKRSGTAL